MKSLLLTDLHLSNKSFKGVSLLEHQVECLLDIIEEEKPHEIIIMGDIFMQRAPSPSALLALKKIIDRSLFYAPKIILIRGNHDSETKSDDGVTALSAFNQVRVIIEFVTMTSTGDTDFDISLEEFNNTTYLGHIHKHSISWNGDNQITVLGTPYTTNFGEEGKLCFYGVTDGEVGGPLNNNFYFKNVTSGPRHLTVSYKNLISDLDVYKRVINEEKFATLLRINVEKDDKIDDVFLDQLKTVYMDFKFLPIEEFKDKDQSEYQPRRKLFTINDQIIEDYVDKHNTSLDKEEIMWGLDLLKNEDR